MANQQSSKGPSLIGQTVPPTAPLMGAQDPSGNVQPIKVDASGNVLTAVSGAGSGGTSAVDGAAFVADTTAGTPAMGAYQSTPSVLTDGDLGVMALDANRNVKVNIVAGSSGNAAAGATGAAVPASADYMGFSDASSGLLTGVSSENLDYDTGGGTAPQTIFGIALPASGGPVAGGTIANPVNVSPAGVAAATVSNVASSASSTSVLASNTSRRAATFYNDADRACYLKYGTTASASSFTVKIFPSGFHLLPTPPYAGAVDAIWDSGPTGSLRVTEY